MSKIEKVKEIMGLGENFHMCDVSEIAEDHIIWKARTKMLTKAISIWLQS